MFLLLTYSFSRFVWLLKTSCGRFSTIFLDRSLKISRGNVLERSENSEKNNISRNVIHAKRRQYEETTAEDHALVSSELKGEGKAERERERDVGESLLKYSDSRPPKAELHEI